MKRKTKTKAVKSVHSTTRRRFLKGAAAGAGVLAFPAIITRRGYAAETLVVAQPGGPYTEGFGVAFGEPFTKDTGIKVEMVARPFFPSAQVQQQVETKSYIWDVVSLSTFDVEILSGLGMLDPIEWSGPDMEQIMPAARRPVWMGTDSYATIMAYRNDVFSNNGPKNWADFWNVGKFKGRRGMYKHPIGTLEEALLADGVSAKDLYPIDFDRAFKKLDEIRPHVDVWWSSGAQSTQLIRDGEVDLIGTWNGRAQVAIDDKSPVTIVWNGLLTLHGFAIPKGSPKADIARQFIKSCASAERQAAYTPYMASGPTNPKAFDHIPADRIKALPTAPGNIDGLIAQDTAWWTANKSNAVDRFNEWLLS